MQLQRTAPAGNAALRRAIYGGAIHRLPSTDASRRLVDEVLALLVAELGPDPRCAQHRLSAGDLFERVGRVRRVLFTDPHYHRRLCEVLAALGFDTDRVAFDPLRLRTVLHRGHENPRAKSVYTPHRDTWYAHPPCVVTGWIPLDDLREEETFVFYPQRFGRAVPNASAAFDYEGWVREGSDLRIGWQQRDSGLRAHYPGAVGALDPGPALGFSCRRGENLLFSGSHFHCTLPQQTGRTRFSLDYRVVHLDDLAAGLGAPDVDNASRGSALPDYVRPAALEPRG